MTHSLDGGDRPATENAGPSRRALVAGGVAATGLAWVAPQVLSMSAAAAASGTEAYYRAQFDTSSIPDPTDGTDTGRGTPTNNGGVCEPGVGLGGWSTFTDLPDCVTFNVTRTGTVVVLTIDAGSVTEGFAFPDDPETATGCLASCIVGGVSGTNLEIATTDLGAGCE